MSSDDLVDFSSGWWNGFVCGWNWHAFLLNSWYLDVICFDVHVYFNIIGEMDHPFVLKLTPTSQKKNWFSEGVYLLNGMELQKNLQCNFINYNRVILMAFLQVNQFWCTCTFWQQELKWISWNIDIDVQILWEIGFFLYFYKWCF